jgi:hypothetical protein
MPHAISRGRIQMPKRIAVERTPILTSSRMSWQAYIVSGIFFAFRNILYQDETDD